MRSQSIVLLITFLMAPAAWALPAPNAGVGAPLVEMFEGRDAKPVADPGYRNGSGNRYTGKREAEPDMEVAEKRDANPEAEPGYTNGSGSQYTQKRDGEPAYGKREAEPEAETLQKKEAEPGYRNGSGNRYTGRNAEPGNVYAD
ncbi:hypothetical protein BDY21DRAFT_348017 [Lineolata rhizophorae]|uniref:Uncharacterized protein n=1 Tax=Lineolata rhizophorae TaxID=578093 RepID=A0A6A6NXG5_9PEZI|nr:hypothetical protein BDY21DRAFT_348017 [Lineolata rhizophorae]